MAYGAKGIWLLNNARSVWIPKYSSFVFTFSVASALHGSHHIVLNHIGFGDINGECQALNLISGSRNVALLRKHPWIWITILKTIFWCLAARFLNVHVNKEGGLKLWTPCCELALYIYIYVYVCIREIYFKNPLSHRLVMERASSALDACLNCSGKEIMF